MIKIDNKRIDSGQMQIFFTAWKEFQIEGKRYMPYFEFQGYLYIDTQMSLTEDDLKSLIRKYITENL